MGKILVACGIVVLGVSTVSSVASADGSDKEVSNVLSINPLEILNGSIGLEYERVLIPRLSLALSAGFYDSSINVFSSNSNGGTGIGPAFTLQPRFYLLRDAPRGLYLSPFVTLDYVSVSGVDDQQSDGMTLSGSGLAYSVGAVIGWSWVFWDVLNVKAGLGLQYEQLSLSVQGTDANGDSLTGQFGGSGATPVGELRLGWAF